MIGFISVLVPISIGAGITYVVVKVAMRRNEQMKQQFKILADALGCQVNLPDKTFFKLEAGFPSINGLLDGKPLSVYMYTVGSGKNQRTYTAFRVKTTNRYSYTFKIYKEGFLSKMGKGLGMQDIEVGDKPFDKSYILKSNDDYFLNTILDEALKSHFLQVHAYMAGEFKLKNDEITYAVMDTITNKTKREGFEQFIYLGSALSDAVTRFSESHKPPGL